MFGEKLSKLFRKSFYRAVSNYIIKKSNKINTDKPRGKTGLKMKNFCLVYLSFYFE